MLCWNVLQSAYTSLLLSNQGWLNCNSMSEAWQKQFISYLLALWQLVKPLGLCCAEVYSRVCLVYKLLLAEFGCLCTQNLSVVSDLFPLPTELLHSCWLLIFTLVNFLVAR